MGKALDLSGLKKGMLSVLDRVENPLKNGTLWNVVCDCGVQRTMRGIVIQNPGTKSCGCIKKSVGADRNRTHGARNTRAFSVWSSMRQRCTNQKFRYFADYGGRGIKVCDRWQVFAAFLADMGQPPEGSTLERVNNDGDYEPSNVRWASKKEQANNRRSSRWIQHAGKLQTLQQWADQTGIKRATIAFRLDSGWPPDRALLP